MTIQFLGCGKLGKIFLELFLDDGVHPENIWVQTGTPESLQLICDQYHTQGGICAHPDIVFLGIKPQQLPTIDLGNHSHNTLIISPLAGIPVSKIVTGGVVYRIMPNILLKQRKGTTLIFSNGEIDEKISWFENILHKCGNIYTCKTEDELDRLTTISGCGPAYFFAFAQIFEELWIQNGGTPQTAHEAVMNIFSGSAEYACATKYTLAEAIATVASKGGMTQAALETLYDRGLKEVIQSGLDNAYKRAKELANN